MKISSVTSNGIFVAITTNGELLALELYNWTPKLPIISPVKLWISEKEEFDENITILCSNCNNRYCIPDTLLNELKRIRLEYNIHSHQSLCIELPHEVWEDPHFIYKCPSCNENLKINPFIHR